MEDILAESELIALIEKDRLKALKRYKLVNGLPKGYFAKLAHAMAETFQTPIALVSIVDKEHVSFPGNAGIPNIDEIPRHISLCSMALLNGQPTVFSDTLKEPELSTNPLIAGDFGLRFYAGAPIVTDDGHALGVVCLVDKVPRTFTDDEVSKLKGFAKTAMQQIALRLKALH